VRRAAGPAAWPVTPCGKTPPGPDGLDRACVYAVDPPVPDPAVPTDSPFGAGAGSGSAAAPGTISKSVTSGTFTRVVSLADGVGSRLVLAAGQPSTPGLERCDATATSFVTLPDHAAGASLSSDPLLTAELDGCGRLLTSDGGARPLPEDLAAALRG